METRVEDMFKPVFPNFNSMAESRRSLSIPDKDKPSLAGRLFRRVSTVYQLKPVVAQEPTPKTKTVRRVSVANTRGSSSAKTQAFCEQYQQNLVDLMISGASYMDVLGKVQDYFMSIFDAETCRIYISTKKVSGMYQDLEFHPTSGRNAIVANVFDDHKTVTHYFLTPETEDELRAQIDDVNLVDIQSYIAVPAIVNGQIVAVVEVFNSRRGAQDLSSTLHQSWENPFIVFCAVAARVIATRAKVAERKSLHVEQEDIQSTLQTAGVHSEKALQNAAQLFCSAISAHRCTVYMVDEKSHIMWSRVSAESERIAVKIGEGLAGQVAKTGEIVNIKDAYEDSRFCKQFDLESGYRTKSVLCVPAFAPDNKIIGVVQMINKIGKDGFNEADEHLCKGLCRHVGTALHNAAMHSAVLRAKEQAQMLLKLSDVLFRELETTPLLCAMRDTIVGPFEAKHCNIYLMKDEDRIYTISKDQHVTLLHNPDATLIDIKSTGRLVANRKHPEFGSQLLIPIKDTAETVIGIAELLGKTGKGYFDQEDEEFASSVAYYLAIALKNAQLFESARLERKRSDALLSVMTAVSTKSNVQSIFTSIEESTCRIVNAQHAVIFLVDKTSNKLYNCSADKPPFSMSISTGIPGRVVETQKPINCERMTSHADYRPEYYETIGIKIPRSTLCIPVKSKNNIVAVLQVVNKNPAGTDFDEQDLKVLLSISGEIRSVIERRSLEIAFAQTEGSAEDDVQSYTNSFLSEYTVQRTDSFKSMISHPASRSNDAQKLIFKWNFDCIKYTADELIDFSIDIFHYFNLLEMFDIQHVTLHRFLNAVRVQYNDLPYHNFLHAFTTLHTTFMIIRSNGEPNAYLNSEDVLAVSIAAFCHDMNHNGRTNDFHIRAQTKYAITYNDQSVLENIHAATCFETMKRPGMDILSNIESKQAYRYIRSSIVTSILATDMQKHSEMVSKMHDRFDKNIFDPNTPADKTLLMNAIVHSSDISNPAFSWEISERWSSKILQEFNAQYEEEKALGFPATPYMSAIDGSPEQARVNMAFIDSCVYPLWNVLGDFLGGLETPLANIQFNRAQWKARDA